MARFVLVHGAFHGGWCWERVVPILQEYGHRVDCVELPGLGQIDAAGAGDWLDAWSDAVTECLCHDPEPAILVGHSRSGIIVSDAAERAPDKVLGLVFLAAIATSNGQTAGALRAAVGSIAHSSIKVRPADDGISAVVDPDTLLKAAYTGSHRDDVQSVRSRLCPEPLAGFAIAPRLSKQRFGKVPKIYIECLRDHAIPIAFQREMQRLLPCCDVRTLDTDHAPYWSEPVTLSVELENCAKQFKSNSK